MIGQHFSDIVWIGTCDRTKMERALYRGALAEPTTVKERGVVATQKSTLTSDFSLVVGRKTWRIQTNRGIAFRARRTDERSERGAEVQFTTARDCNYKGRKYV